MGSSKATHLRKLSSDPLMQLFGKFSLTRAVGHVIYWRIQSQCIIQAVQKPNRTEGRQGTLNQSYQTSTPAQSGTDPGMGAYLR